MYNSFIRKLSMCLIFLTFTLKNKTIVKKVKQNNILGNLQMGSNLIFRLGITHKKNSYYVPYILSTVSMVLKRIFAQQKHQKRGTKRQKKFFAIPQVAFRFPDQNHRCKKHEVKISTRALFKYRYLLPRCGCLHIESGSAHHRL